MSSYCFSKRPSRWEAYSHSCRYGTRFFEMLLLSCLYVPSSRAMRLPALILSSCHCENQMWCLSAIVPSGKLLPNSDDTIDCMGFFGVPGFLDGVVGPPFYGRGYHDGHPFFDRFVVLTTIHLSEDLQKLGCCKSKRVCNFPRLL